MLILIDFIIAYLFQQYIYVNLFYILVYIVLHLLLMLSLLYIKYVSQDVSHIQVIYILSSVIHRFIHISTINYQVIHNYCNNHNYYVYSYNLIQ